MVDPKIMCRQHLLGEHVECHMLYGSIVEGLYKHTPKRAKILCPERLHFRHYQLSEEMRSRGYNHKSPMLPYPRGYKPDRGEISVSDSLGELLHRCPSCRANWEKLNGPLPHLSS